MCPGLELLFSRNVSLSFYLHTIHSVEFTFTKSWIFISEKSGPGFLFIHLFIYFSFEISSRLPQVRSIGQREYNFPCGEAYIKS